MTLSASTLRSMQVATGEPTILSAALLRGMNGRNGRSHVAGARSYRRSECEQNGLVLKPRLPNRLEKAARNEEIRALVRDGGMGIRPAARRFGLAPSRIHQIVNERRSFMFHVRDEVTQRVTIAPDLDTARIAATNIVKRHSGRTAVISDGLTGKNLERFYLDDDEVQSQEAR